MAFRATESDKAIIERKSLMCALSQSEYVRRCAIGHNPQRRLTPEEVDAYISLADARRDLINMKNAMSNWLPEERRLAFKDPDFVEDWLHKSEKLIARWYEIESKMLE